jgi:hypothetical protein
MSQTQGGGEHRKTLESHEYLANWLARAETWPGVTAPGLRNGDELGDQFITVVREIVAYSVEADPIVQGLRNLARKSACAAAPYMHPRPII